VSRQGRPYTKSGPILSDVEREPDSLDDAEIRFEFSPAMRRVIADSTHWAAVSRRAVLSFESRYSLRLYLFLSLRANLRKVSEELSIDDLREMLGVPSHALPRWQDVKRRALDPAMAEINHVAGFHAAYEPIKRGRRIVGVRLAWGLKDRAELVKAQRELDRPRVGRTARRDGVVETIAQERYRLAENLANAPGLERLSEPEQ
jgi:plasmid replication initiation protein